MNDLRETTRHFLLTSASRMRSDGLPEEFAARFDALASQVDQPCVVAVVGGVKAGKSTFLNAVLGEDLARVGVTETTATINRFRYGVSDDPERPVRCHWRAGHVTQESRDFLDSLQGHDEATLRRADQIAFLEFLLPHDVLKEITLVDTPGTGAVVESHQERLDAYLDARRRLAQRHGDETEREADAADAVIHLVGAAPRAADRQLLQQFSSGAGNERAQNALGVLAKIDLHEELLDRRDVLSERLSAQLRDQLNTVVPVSAALHQALQRLERDRCRGLAWLAGELRRIPPDRLSVLLESEEFFSDLELDECPLSVADRRALRTAVAGDAGQPLPWRAFVCLARIAGDPEVSLAEVESRLRELAGFDRLRETLQRHFFSRSRMLRCFRVMQEARRVLNQIRFEWLPSIEGRAEREQDRLNRALRFLQQAAGDHEVRAEIEDLVKEHYDGTRRHAAGTALYGDLDLQWSRMMRELKEVHRDWEALQLLEEQGQQFDIEEREELRGLLGLYGLDVQARCGDAAHDPERLRERQLQWKVRADRARQEARRTVCLRAERCYRAMLFARRGESGDAA